LSLRNCKPNLADEKLTEDELVAIFLSDTILSRVLELCSTDEELNFEEFHKFVNHPSIQTYLFIIVDGETGGVGNNKLSRKEYVKLGVWGDKGDLNLKEFRELLSKEEITKGIFIKIQSGKKYPKEEPNVAEYLTQDQIKNSSQQ